MIIGIIIHQTHYEKSDWSRAFNQFTIACELDMINVLSAADITSIMSNSTSAWLLSPYKMAERFASVSEDELCEKCINYRIRFSHDIMNCQTLVSVLSASAFGFGR